MEYEKQSKYSASSCHKYTETTVGLWFVISGA